MAVIFTLLSMLMTCASDLFEKKSVSFKTEEVIKTLVWYGIFNALLLVAVLLFGLDETSLLPHQLILKKPIIIISPILNYVCLFFALVAYKYVGARIFMKEKLSCIQYLVLGMLIVGAVFVGLS